MTINRSALRRSTAQELLKKIKEKINQAEIQQNLDNRFWKPTVDSNGNAFAVIRFLPSKTEDSLPFVRAYSHGFKVGSRWFIEECPTTIGEKCPVCEYNTKLWNSGFENDKQIVRERKRRLRFISNIMVIKDPKNPENENKIFLFSYGQKIYDKLITVMNPPEEYGEEPRDPFGFFDGCVVKLKIKNKDGYRNYDDTTVEPASDLYNGDEEKLMEVLDQMYDLNEFTNPSRFKSYEELNERFLIVLGEKTSSNKKDNDEDEDEDEDFKSKPEKYLMGTEYGSHYTKNYEDEEETKSKTDSDDLSEDDDLAYFKSLIDD